MPTNRDLLLSIILPIYNVEPYLEKCILSLENQDIPKDSYEIICVNDGSPDNSKSIVTELQLEFSNIKLIDQYNQGVSVARNNGIKLAKGKYLLFVDPDDSIRENSLKDLILYTEINQYEVVYSPFITVEMNGDKRERLCKKSLKKLFDGPDLYFAVRGSTVIDPDRSWSIIYERELITDNKLFYTPNVPYLEDGEFIARVLCLTKRGSIYNKPYYLRLNRPGSATRSNLVYQRKTILGFVRAANNLSIFKRNKNLSTIQEGLINGRIVKFVVLSVQATTKSFNNFKWVKKILKKEQLSKLDLYEIKDLYLKLGSQYNQSINLFYLRLIMKRLIKSIKLKLS